MRIRSGFALSLLLAPFGAVQGQTIWTPVDHQMHLRVEWWHPHVSDGGGVTAVSGPRFFSASFPVGERVSFAFEVPFARARTGGTVLAPPYADASMGNWYVGLQLSDLLESRGFVGEVGARLSATTDDAYLARTIGSVADPERFEAFLPSSVSVSGAGNLLRRVGAVDTRLRLGVTQILSGTITGVGNHTLIDYGARATRDVQGLRLAGALNGRYATDGRGPFGDRFSDFATGSAGVTLGAFRPSVSLRIPFERSMRRVAPWMVGLSVEVTLRGKRC